VNGMDHQEAVRSMATERYLLGELDDAGRRSFEEHLFGCLECAADVEAATQLLVGVHPLLPAVSAPPAVARPLRRVVSVFWPVPVGALAASLVLVVGAAYWGRALGARQAAIEPLPFQFLAVARAEPPEVVVSPEDRVLGLALGPSVGEAFSYYRCTLKSGAGATLSSSVMQARSGEDEMQLLVPIAGLPPGPYAIVTSGLTGADDNGPGTEVGRYPFVLKHRGVER
jgi:hypothetical protein